MFVMEEDYTGYNNAVIIVNFNMSVLQHQVIILTCKEWTDLLCLVNKREENRENAFYCEDTSVITHTALF